MNGDDIRMIESRGRPRFLHKPAHSLGIAGELLGKDLESDAPVELCIVSQIHFTHPARADLGDDSIVREGFADHSALRLYRNSPRPSIERLINCRLFHLKSSVRDWLVPITDQATAG